MRSSPPGAATTGPTATIQVFDSAAAAAAVAADLVAELVHTTPTAVLGVATGSTPSPLYAELAARSARGEVDLRSTSAFALDEYVGIALDHPERYRAVIDREVRVPLGLEAHRVHVPDGAATDLDEAGRAYDDAIRLAGGIDLQILGIGGNGHIGFNEPGTPHDAPTHAVRLAEGTRAANARFFDGRLELVPTRALTQGIGTILQARRIVLIATGAAKADAIARAVLGPVDPTSPASALQRHPAVTLLLDRAAASALQA